MIGAEGGSALTMDPIGGYILPVPNSRVAIYAGSFDPITRGHEDLMHRSLEYVDRLVVAVATNSTKTPLFSIDERVSMTETRPILDAIGGGANRLMRAELSEHQRNDRNVAPGQKQARHV